MTPNSLLIKATILSVVVGQSLCFTTSSSSTIATSSSTKLMAESSRRNFINNFGAIAAGSIVSLPSVTNALDFDAFEKGEVESDTKNCNPKFDPKCIPKLTADEALCQYGKSGQARGEACQRVKKSGGKLPEVTKEKSLGGAYAM